MSPNNLARNDATVSLALLEAEGAIVGHMTNFRRLGEPGVRPKVAVTIAATDELALERVKRQVRKAVEPFVPGVQVTVLSDPVQEKQP